VLVPVNVAVPPDTLVAVVAEVAEVAVAALPPIDNPEAVPVNPVPGPLNCVEAVIVVPPIVEADIVPPVIDVVAVNVETVRLFKFNAPNAAYILFVPSQNTTVCAALGIVTVAAGVVPCTVTVCPVWFQMKYNLDAVPGTVMVTPAEALPFVRLMIIFLADGEVSPPCVRFKVTALVESTA
jgi:hypothetical protein